MNNFISISWNRKSGIFSWSKPPSEIWFGFWHQQLIRAYFCSNGCGSKRRFQEFFCNIMCDFYLCGEIKSNQTDQNKKRLNLDWCSENIEEKSGKNRITKGRKIKPCCFSVTHVKWQMWEFGHKMAKRGLARPVCVTIYFLKPTWLNASKTIFI